MDAILVFVDRMTKMAHFISCTKTTDAPAFANLFISNIVRLHGLPASIVSDCGSIFTSNFWSTLASILRIDPRKLIAFHPQTDGQTERTNQTLETYLRIFVNQDQDDWFDLLPLAEFEYNNTLNESTRMSPFYANYGLHPRFLTEFVPTDVPAANEFASHLRDVHDRLVENVKRAQDFQARHYNAKHKPIEFQPGDLVWLNATNITTTRPSKKLDWKRLGPFKIVKRIGLQAYELNLPITMRRIHNVFHVSLFNHTNQPRFHLTDSLLLYRPYTPKTTKTISKSKLSATPNATDGRRSTLSNGKGTPTLTILGNPSQIYLHALSSKSSTAATPANRTHHVPENASLLSTSSTNLFTNLLFNTFLFLFWNFLLCVFSLLILVLEK
jgi:hypothetical protein